MDLSRYLATSIMTSVLANSTAFMRSLSNLERWRVQRSYFAEGIPQSHYRPPQILVKGKTICGIRTAPPRSESQNHGHEARAVAERAMYLTMSSLNSNSICSPFAHSTPIRFACYLHLISWGMQASRTILGPLMCLTVFCLLWTDSTT